MSVLIKQKLTWESAFFNHTMCCPTPKIKYNDCKTNILLDDFRLNEDIINQEIRKLNSKAKEFASQQTDCSHCWCCLIPLLVVIGFILFILFAVNNFGPGGVFGWLLIFYIILATIGCFKINRCIMLIQKMKWDIRLAYIEKYINEELNPRYESSHIVWCIKPKCIIYGSNNGKCDFSYEIRYNNIRIFPQSHAPISVQVPTNDRFEKAVEEEINDDAGENETEIEVKIHSQNKIDLDQLIFESNSVTGQGGYYKFQCFGTDKVIEVADNSKTVGSCLQICDDKETDNQIFYVERIDGDYYTIRCKHSGLYWNIVGASKNNNRKIVQWSYHGLDNQQFKFVQKNGQNFQIIIKHSEKALSIENGLNENGSNIVQYDITDDPEQIFYRKSC